MRMIKRMLTMAAGLSLICGVALAGAPYNAVRVSQPIERIGDAVTLEDCQVGNLNPGVYVITPSFFGPVELAFDPGATCNVCTVGMRITVVHVVLHADIACSIDLNVDVRTPDYPGAPDCPQPGTVICTSALYGIALPDAGNYDIAVPIECDCAALGYTYLIGAQVLNIDCTGITSPMFDGMGTPCVGWWDLGGGWTDVYDWLGMPIPGNPALYAEIACCETPVATNSQTWGSLKSLYR